MATDTKTPIETGEAPAAEAAETTAIAPKTESAPEPRPPVEFDPDNPVDLYMNNSVFEQVQRVARLMAAAQAVPEHLRNKIGDCFLIAAQAFRWRMDPFAVAQHTFVYQGKLGYEGKLVAAVINSDKRIGQRLDYAYSGTKGTPERSVVVTARLRGENKDRCIDGTVKDWKTGNDKWTSMPDQMLAYRGAREWARRHAPEILLGVSTEDEIKETVDLQPTGPGTYAAPPDGGTALDALTDRIAERQAAEKAAEPPAAQPVEHASHSEKEIPLEEDTLAEAAAAEKPAPQPEPDPRTEPGNPFLRGERKAREARGQKTLTE